MSKDAIDTLIEEWAKGRAESVREAVDKPLEGFETWTLTLEEVADQVTFLSHTGKTDGPKSAFVSPDRLDPAGDICAKDTLAPTPLDAAHAVREAVVAKGGKRPSVDSWKSVAAKVLGLKRLVTKRWQGVLDVGVEAGLFTIDTEALSYPIIVAAESLPEPEPEVLPEPEPERKAAPSTVPTKLPDDWVPPRTFRCGHSNWPGQGLTEDAPKQVAAREAGFCCARVAEADATSKRLNPHVQATPPVPIEWRVKGLYEPVPVKMRRTAEREAGLGWPGLCCHPETGLYIGGVGNNCLGNTDKSRCVVHASKPRK